ncbi:hypothetical protein WA1_37400 [Scytonema hofmannii PCC 7110]|uniref:Uncharacterized protein n=1 Tax=Scytonema hofmannii PCC 7110 TaxID=128403 RepID=A0A139X049_9CYAN|nr:hypothetical protein [Scytonema hofmannii]KYC38036.1 hypothetical protein WA1_37400 [Scytonema hofmannii PCC 7110]
MKLSRHGNRGGRRENAGRKAIWNNKDTITIRVPKVLATQVMELAHRLDSGESFENVSQSKRADFDLITKSSDCAREAAALQHRQDEIITKSRPGFESEFETITNSMLTNSDSIENVTKSIRMNEAIELAKKILKHKKSARQTVAKLLSKLYSNAISFNDLK